MTFSHETVDLSERERGAARAGLLPIGLVIGGIGCFYLLDPPLDPGWIYAGLSLGTSAILFGIWVAIRRVRASAVTPLLTAGCMTVVIFALGFVAFTGDANQSMTLLLTLFAAGCLLVDLRAIVAVVVSGTLGWILLLPMMDPAPDARWSIDLVATALIAIVVTAVRRRTLVELETLSRQNRLLVDSAGEAIYGLDERGAILFANPAAERVLGRPVRELLRQSEHLLLHFEPQGERTYPANSCPFCHEKETTPRAALPLLRPSGEIAWVEVTRTQVPHPDAIRAVVTLRDVTEQTWTQRALRESEEKHRLVVDTALDGVVTLDQAGRITGWNRQAKKIFGWTSAEVMGLRALDTLVPSAWQESFRKQWEEILDLGGRGFFGRRVEIPGLRSSGEEFSLELSISPIGESPHRHYTAFVRDITERVEAERRLRDAKEAAEAAAMTKSNFLATMSHEIRTPLNGIFGMTELALDTRDDVERRDFLNRARSCAHSLMAILNDVLDFSKIEAGHFPIENLAFDPEILLDGIIDTLAADADRKGLELVGSLAGSPGVRLMGDPDRLRQVLLNLGGNAIKFTQAGNVLVHLRTERSPDGSKMLLHGQVRDTGIGIAANQKTSIFKSFTQADGSTTRLYGGTGLGLAIAQRLVRLMQGEIRVESELGSGSLFSFTVPLDRVVEPARTPAWRSAGLRVLIVDDNALCRQHLADRFADWGCHAQGVADGASACAILQKAQRAGAAFNLVLVDLDMPDPDGLKTARWIRASRHGADIPIIALTPLARSSSGATVGFDFQGALTKPIRQRQLGEVLEALGQGARKPVRRPLKSA